MRSTARTKRMLQEIMNEERNGTTLDYRDGVVNTLRWMLRESNQDPIAKTVFSEEPAAVTAESEKPTPHAAGRSVPKPGAGSKVRRKR